MTGLLLDAATQSESQKAEKIKDMEATNTTYRQEINKTIDYLQQEIKNLKTKLNAKDEECQQKLSELKTY